MAVPGVKQHVTPEKVIRYINDYTGLDITLNTRKREVVEARQVAMVIIKNTTHTSLSNIGKKVGLTHATVLHAIKVVPQYFEVDKQYRRYWDPVFSNYEITI